MQVPVFFCEHLFPENILRQLVIKKWSIISAKAFRYAPTLKLVVEFCFEIRHFFKSLFYGRIPVLFNLVIYFLI
jgi:hypothetical protein